MKPSKIKYNDLLNNIGFAIQTARQNAFKAVNTEMVKANWEIGRHIVEFEQHGHERAEYGRRNVLDMRRFYLAYPKWQTVSAKLSWSHFIVLLGVSDDTTRKFYEKQAISENWSKRELERQIDSSLFERLALLCNLYRLSLNEYLRSIIFQAFSILLITVLYPALKIFSFYYHLKFFKIRSLSSDSLCCL